MGSNPSGMRYFKVFSMLESQCYDIYKLSVLVEPELVCNLKPSDWDTWEKSICATGNSSLTELSAYQQY